jgi:hypothetical protein
MGFRCNKRNLGEFSGPVKFGIIHLHLMDIDGVRHGVRRERYTRVASFPEFVYELVKSELREGALPKSLDGLYSSASY